MLVPRRWFTDPRGLSAVKRSPVRPCVLVPVLAGALLAAGCSAEPASDEAHDGPLHSDSPLATYMGDLWYIDLDAMEDYGRKSAELVAQCMADEGFEYAVDRPDDASDDIEQFSSDEMNTEAWIATHGYGIFTNDPAVFAPYEDPNAEYVASLSAASRAAYEEALYGTWNGMTDDQGVEERGCEGQASAELSGTVPLNDPRMEALTDEMIVMEEDLGSSPEIIAVDEAWADCMADAGFGGFATPQEAEDSFFDDAFGYDGSDRGTQDDDEFAEAREREIDTALADYACRQDTGHDTISLNALHAAEEQFIVDHKAQIDELIAEYGS